MIQTRSKEKLTGDRKKDLSSPDELMRKAYKQGIKQVFLNQKV